MDCRSRRSRQARFANSGKRRFLICKSRRLLRSENCDRRCGHITSDLIVILSGAQRSRRIPRSYRGWSNATGSLDFAQNDGLTEGLFLHDLGVLDHGDTATLGELAFHGDVFTAVLSELLVDWLVFANHQIGFAFAYNTD